MSNGRAAGSPSQGCGTAAIRHSLKILLVYWAGGVATTTRYATAIGAIWNAAPGPNIRHLTASDVKLTEAQDWLCRVCGMDLMNGEALERGRQCRNRGQGGVGQQLLGFGVLETLKPARLRSVVLTVVESNGSRPRITFSSNRRRNRNAAAAMCLACGCLVASWATHAYRR